MSTLSIKADEYAAAVFLSLLCSSIKADEYVAAVFSYVLWSSIKADEYVAAVFLSVLCSSIKADEYVSGVWLQRPDPGGRRRLAAGCLRRVWRQWQVLRSRRVPWTLETK